MRMSASSSSVPSHRRSSRSNSISSSVVTVKKSASVSSHGGSRTSYLRNRSSSPDSISKVLHSLNSSRSEYRNRPDAHEGRKTNSALNVNRWSHSTSSSLSAIDNDLIRKRTSSVRRSIGPGFGSNGNASVSHSHTGSDPKFDIRGSPKRTSTKSSAARSSPLPGSKLAFNDSSNLKIVQDLSQSSNSSSSTDFFGSTWEQSSGKNKFGEPVQSLAIHYTSSNTNTSQLADSLHVRMDSNERPSTRLRASEGRRRDRSENRSRDDTESSSASPARNQVLQDKDIKSPKRKDMLSKALAKANQAVLLDNAQNINAAIEAYNEACELLSQVMARSADFEDRKKLSSIRSTYSNRIAELHDLDESFSNLMDRPLPDDPPTDGYEQPEDFYHEDASYQASQNQNAPVLQLPLRQESLLPEIFGGDNYIQNSSLPPVRNPIRNSTLNVPMDAQYMPQPLSPRPPPGSSDEQNPAPQPADTEHQPRSTSWLEPFDRMSSNSSSRLSSIEIERKDTNLLSAIEAEFDAMNAAVDAAYDDDIDQEPTPRNADKTMDFQPIESPSGLATRVARRTSETNRFDLLSSDYLDDEAEEEERLLEGVTEGYDLSEAEFGQRTMSALPRQSDSSGFSGRTWGSSVASTTATTRTTLSTLAETLEPPLHAPLRNAPPEPPRSPPRTEDSEDSNAASKSSPERPAGIRDRRMSGQSAKQLKIETFARRSSTTQQMRPPIPEPVVAPSIEEPKKVSSDPIHEPPTRSLLPAASFSSISSLQPSTPLLPIYSGDVHQFESPATPALTQTGSTDDGNVLPPSPTRQGKMLPPSGPIIKKNVSSSSLARGNLSINTATIDTDIPMTPGSANFSKDGRGNQSATTPAVYSANPNMLTTTALGGMYLFDDLVGSSGRPRSSGHNVSEPAPLEPCPEPFLLRPFWLMRCLYQTLSHPKGGYISTKLFVPRDIWRVRNIKIKAVDDKIAQCDLLTAALQKLAKVDTLDANAVLEELQSFETILDQVRTALSKKLGNDVGLSGSASVFKSSPAVEDSVDSLSSRSTNASSAAKSIASSWRKLRSKSSSAALNTSARNEASSHNLTIASLPMTSSAPVPTSRSYLNARNRHPPPTPSSLPQLLAPHAYYICSLARLFDAVQILDNIARQVEDPGLKCSSQTHVGLELSVRNAAEFFAFYIIRFVMTDLLALMDKYLKRSSEWVMA